MSTPQKRGLPFKGELHDIHLINFSVDPEEVRRFLPPPLRLRTINGRALISMVDVHLRNMRPDLPLLRAFPFNYQHIGFRLLIEDAAFHDQTNHKGIFFLRSFTDRNLLSLGGKLLTDYRLEKAMLNNFASGLRVDCKGKYLQYVLDNQTPEESDAARQLYDNVKRIDRAYAVNDDAVYKTQIQREKWPIKAVHCNHFSTNFFETARFEGAFKVSEVIHYRWLPAEIVPQTARQAEQNDLDIALNNEARRAIPRHNRWSPA